MKRMNKWIVASVLAAEMLVAMGARAESGARVTVGSHGAVQLWEGGPYWAETNLGAEKPWEYGLYFWWGDMVGYKWENEAWVASDGAASNFSFSEGNTPTYNKDTDQLKSEGWITAEGVLSPEHDAAQVQWGGGWRMPTGEEVDDLCYDKCDWTWMTTNGVNGYVVRGRGDFAGASIFIPASGYIPFGRVHDSAESNAFLWSSSGRDTVSWCLVFGSDHHDVGPYARWCGYSIRPVRGGGEAPPPPGEGVNVSVTNVTARQRYPWNGLVDIDYELSCSNPATNVSLYVSARDEGTGKSIPVRTVKLEGGEFGEELVVKAQDLPGGKGRLVWDAGKDAPGTVADAVTVEVQALAGEGMYMVVDLSAGSGDGAVYPVSYMGAEPQGGWTDEFKTTKLVLRRILPGTFTMGSPADEVGRYGDSTSYNEIQHEVTITQSFYMGVFEVTQKQWKLVMGSNPSSFTGDMRPVEGVPWDTIRGNSSTYNWPASAEVDAASFMGKLRARAGGFVWDLPTEAQWEYACRAGTTTALNSGKNLTGTSSCTNMAEVGRYSYNKSDGKGGYIQHTTVGSYLPNAWGLYDMHGNVCEWCLDWLASVTADPVTDTVGPASGSLRVLRGGGCNNSARYCRSAYRYGNDPSNGNYNLGLRLCCSAGLQ